MVAVVSRADSSIPAMLCGGWWCFHTPFPLTLLLLGTAEEDLGSNIWYSSQIILWYLWQRVIEFPLFSTGPKAPYSPAGEVSVWLVDAPPPSRSASRLRNAGRCWRGNAPPRSRRGVPDGAGLFYSSPIGCQFPTWPPRLGAAGALSTNGCSGFWRRAWRDWPTNQAAAIIVRRASLPWLSSIP